MRLYLHCQKLHKEDLQLVPPPKQKATPHIKMALQRYQMTASTHLHYFADQQILRCLAIQNSEPFDVLFHTVIHNSVEAAKAAAAGNMIAVRTKLGAEYAALAEEIIQYDDLQGIRGADDETNQN